MVLKLSAALVSHVARQMSEKDMGKKVGVVHVSSSNNSKYYFGYITRGESSPYSVKLNVNYAELKN